MGLFKKLVLGGLVAGGAVAAFKGTHAITHVSHEVREARRWAEDQVPMAKKFKVLREEVAQLDGEVDRVKTELAREIVEARDLTATTARLRAKVSADKKAVLAQGQAIKDATGRVKYGSREVSVEQATARLARDVAAHQADAARLGVFEATLANREENRDTLQKTLDALVGKKDEMLAEIDAVEADYKRLQLAQVQSKYQTDDTKLARIKGRLADLKKQVAIQSVRLDMEPVGKDDAAAAGKSVDDILRPVTGDAKADAKGEEKGAE